MKLSTEQISAVARWRAKSRNGKQGNIEEIQELLGLQRGSLAGDEYELDGHFAYPADRADFDPDYIEGELGASRYEEISSGQNPTEEELSMWAEKKDSLVFEDDGWWYHFYVWRVDLPEEQLYFRSLHGDGGLLDEFDGPFGSEEEALQGAGNLELNPRP